ncbi:hypothetical protein J132_09372 [Termitomyces sp. J132]|nr:hypothetical protein J132_09372 [Termitomyces sp. J132]
MGEEWVHPFDVHFAPVNPSLEFLMDDLTAGMTVSAPAVASAGNTAKHLVGVLAVARGEGRSEGCGDNEAVNRGDIQKVGPLTPKAVAGGVARGLATLPRLGTTPRSKGKGKGKAQDKEDEDIEDQIEEMFTNKHLAALLRWQKALMVVDTGLGAGVKLEKAKGKVMVSLEKRQEYKHTQGAEASNMEVKGEEELKAVPAMAEEDKEEKRAEEVERTWSNMPLRQVGDDKLEWLGEDLGWPTLLTSAALLADFDERAAEVEWQFQRELEVAREELLAARARYTITKQTLATLAGYRHDCQAFLAWQEENNVGEGDWEEAEAMEVPDNDADFDT